MRKILTRFSMFFLVLLASGCSKSSLGGADEWLDSIQGLWRCVGECGMSQVRFIREGNVIKALKAGSEFGGSGDLGDSEVWLISLNGEFDDKNALLPVTITYYRKRSDLPGCLEAMEKGVYFGGSSLSVKQNFDAFVSGCGEKTETSSYTMKNGSMEKDKFVPVFLSESGMMQTPFEFSFIRENTSQEAANVTKTFESFKAERANYKKTFDEFVAKMTAKGFRPPEDETWVGAAPAAEPDPSYAAAPAAEPDPSYAAAPAAEAPRN